MKWPHLPQRGVQHITSYVWTERDGKGGFVVRDSSRPPSAAQQKAMPESMRHHSYYTTCTSEEERKGAIDRRLEKLRRSGYDARRG